MFLKNLEKVGFDEVLKEYLKEELILYEKIKDFKIKVEKLEFLSVELNVLKCLCEYFEKGGLEENLFFLVREIEMFFMKVLMGMEF